MTEFETQCRARVGQLRTAFIELYDSIGADPASPQDVARNLRVNKTLTWNVARLLQDADALAVVNHVPGANSMEKLIAAISRRGADADLVARARDAVRDFHQMIKSQAGDRHTLDLIIDGTTATDNTGLELSRKLAFRGNSGLYGVQARTRLVTHFLTPNPGNPNRLDMGMISGYVDFRRLRAGVRWPIFMMRSWGAADDPVLTPGEEPIELEGNAPGDLPLMRSFVRGTIPKITQVVTPEGRDFVLDQGPIGNDGAFDCFWGDIVRSAVARYADTAGEVGEFGAAITAPVEKLVMDIIVDRDLDFALEPELLVFGHIFAHGKPTGGKDDPSLLPIQEPVRPLTGGPPLVNTASVPNYAKIAAKVYDRMQADPTRLRGVRMTMEYPPLGANVILRFKLPTVPK